MAYERYVGGGLQNGQNNSTGGGFGFDDFLDDPDDGFSRGGGGGGGRGFADPYAQRYNGRSELPSGRLASDPYSGGRTQDPLYSGGRADRPFAGGRGDFDDLDSRGDPLIDESLLRNPYIRNKVRAADAYRISAPAQIDGLQKSRGHYRTDSYNSSLSATDAIYSKPMTNRNSALIRSPPAIYTLDHLATFTVSQRQRLLTAEDAMHQLRHMEKTTGVWTMRVELRIDEREIVVTETASQKEIESFPVSYVSNPVSVISSEREEVYNNILIFTVQIDGGGGTEMNVFQCIGVTADDVVADILAATTGRFPRQKKIPPPVKEKPRSPEPYPASSQLVQPPIIPQPSPAPIVEPTPPPQPEPISKEKQNEVEHLNHCFDDIERFVADIQKAAAAKKEFEKKKQEGASQADLDYFKERSQPPSTEEYVTVFQKFKYAYNLLPRLKDILKDPSAGDLVRSLFSPLTAVLNSSRDSDGKLKLADSVSSPLLTVKACQLMQTNLDSRDFDLWQSIGESWTVPEEKWQGPPVSPYVPEFDNPRTQYNSQAPRTAATSGNQETMGAQARFLNELKSRNCKICQVISTRAATKEKELTVTAGEYLEIINDEKNWWKVENIRNKSGYAPKTILNRIQ